MPNMKNRHEARVSASGGFGLALRLEVTIPNLPRHEAQNLLEAAHSDCLYSNAVRGNVDVGLLLV